MTEQRELTMYDENSDPLVTVMPPEWRQLPGTRFRIFNYRFGKDGEVYVTRASGGVLENVNRWLKQFSKEPLEQIDDLPKVEVLGKEGILVSAKGRFAGGMGKPAKENAALLGVIVQVGGQLLTVKMIGDADAVEAERDRLIQFCNKLRIRESKPEEDAQ